MSLIMKFRAPDQSVFEIPINGKDSFVKIKVYIKDKLRISEKQIQLKYRTNEIPDHMLFEKSNIETNGTIDIELYQTPERENIKLLNVKRKEPVLDQWIMLKPDSKLFDVREAILGIMDEDRNFELVDRSNNLLTHEFSVSDSGIADRDVLFVINDGRDGEVSCCNIIGSQESILIKYKSNEKVLEIKQKLATELKLSCRNKLALFCNRNCLIDDKPILIYGLKPRDNLSYVLIDSESSNFEFDNASRKKGLGCVQFKAKRKDNGQYETVHRYPIDISANEELYKHTTNEIVALSQVLDHANIVQLKSLFMTQKDNKHYFCVGLEYFDQGTLYDYVLRNKVIEEKKTVELMIQVAEALNELHTYKIIHRDIRCSSIYLCDDQKTVKLGNFSMSKYMMDSGPTGMELGVKMSCMVYVYNWMSPEMAKEGNVGTKSDVWSFGVTIIELLTGKPIYGNLTGAAVLPKLINITDYHSKTLVSAGLTRIIDSCLKTDPTQRPTASQLIDQLKELK